MAPPPVFQGEAKTIAPAASAACAVATLAESGEPSVTGIRRAVKPSWPSPFPNATARSATVKSPAHFAWLIPPKPRMYCLWLPSVTVAVCADARAGQQNGVARAQAATITRRTYLIGTSSRELARSGITLRPSLGVVRDTFQR